jgi:hypothetical protein
MTFDTHAFISYGHTDNIPTPDEDGWVTRFHKFLNAYLSAELGEAARIWRDEKLQGNDAFSDEILKRIESAAAVVAIVSPRYMVSEWCIKEADAFCHAAENHGGLAVGERFRFFPVALKPLDEKERKRLPGSVNEMLGYPFYREMEQGRHERLDPSFGSPEIYKARVARLAGDIADVIMRLRETVPAPAAPASDKPVIYLAECGYDRLEDRERIWSELTSHGYRVVPEQPSLLADIEPQYVDEVTRLLEQCELAIHLVGAYAGKTPDGPSRTPVVALQNEIAARMSAERGLPRLIWLPEGTPTDAWSFVEELPADAGMQRGADLITGGFEELKSAVRVALKKLERSLPDSTPVATESGAATVYIVCVEEDIDELMPLVELLQAKGLEVEFPVFEGGATEVREANERLSSSCDAVLLFWGAGSGAWRAQQESELQRVRALRRGRPLRAVFTYLSGPPARDKQFLLMKKRPDLIDALGGFQEGALDPFLGAIADAGRQQLETA